MTKSANKSLAVAGYPALVKKIQTELSELDFFVKRRTAESYWKVGKFIHEHLLENKDRADYGHYILERLAEDVDRDQTTLAHALRFYRVYPILAPGQELTWGHYRTLITVQDREQRKKLEEQIVRQKWDTHKLQEYLNVKRELEAEKDDSKPIVQLKMTRGKAGICQVVKSEDGGAPHLLDLGFRMRRALSNSQASRLKEGDCVEVTQDKGEWSIRKTDVTKDELFTYKANVDRVVDGDTLWVTIDAGFDIFIEQKLRLRGIDCPEMDTDEGKAAKKFVEARLKVRDTIIIKTHKDSVDKYDRYLANVFYGEEEKFLNQELLDERLAVVYQ